MKRRGFLKRMASAVVGVGLLGIDLMERGQRATVLEPGPLRIWIEAVDNVSDPVADIMALMRKRVDPPLSCYVLSPGEWAELEHGEPGHVASFMDVLDHVFADLPDMAKPHRGES